MNVRNLRESDIPRLKELFAEQGFEYELPDLSAMLACQVVVDENDAPVMCVAARQTCELYLLADKSWRTPQWRMEALKMVHESMRRTLEAQGIDDVHIWIPPQVALPFGRRLMRDFGWKQPLWTDFVRSTHG